MTERLGELLLALLIALGAAINHWAAAGAMFGCCFFLATPSTTVGWGRVGLGMFSFGIGYAAGIFLYGGGPPFNEKAMFVSGGLSAIAAGAWASLGKAIDKSGPLPPWLSDILDRVPFLKRQERSGDDNIG